MNNDLISRSALLKEGIRGKYLVGADGSILIPVHCVRKYIKEATAVDAVIPVRCRDCKYWGDEDGKLQRSDGVLFARCKVHNYLIDGRHTGWCPTENDFCSYGERKEGAD